MKFPTHFILVLCFFIHTSTALAQTSHCDPQVMDLMRSHAWIAAQREMSQNKNLIFKPDSTLEYSCFDDLMLQPAVNLSGQRPFTELGFNAFANPFFYPPTISTTSTDEAIKTAVGEVMVSYFQKNFPDAYLNARTNLNDSYSPQANSYDCQNMSRVWEAAKCMNFVNKPEDGFYDFATYAVNDPRKLPPFTQACSTNVFGRTLMEAFNQRPQFFNVDPSEEIFRDGRPYDSNEFNLLYDASEPPNTTLNPQNCANAPKFKTGVKVTQMIPGPTGQPPSIREYNEYSCISPTCVYIPTAMDSGFCNETSN